MEYNSPKDTKVQVKHMQEILIKAGCYIAIILLGMGLRRIGFFKQEDFSVLSKIVIKITLPASVLANTAGMEIAPELLALVGLGIGCALLQMGAAWLMNRKKGREQLAFGILNLPGYNIGVFAMPFVGGFLGSTGILATSLFDGGNAFVSLGGSLGVASAVKDGAGFQVKRIFKSLGKSVPFMTYLIVTLMNILRIRVPGPILSCAGIVGNGNAFLAMLMIGVGFQLDLNREQVGRAARLLGVRYGLAAVLAVAFYFLLPYGLEIRKTLVLLMFAPIPASVPGFTAEIDGDVGLSCTTNSLAIICSIVLMVTLLVVM